MSHASPIIHQLEQELARPDVPEFRPGDRIAVHAVISEGGKDRIQVFEGICIHRKNKGLRGSFTVRKVTDNVGVERVWSLASPRVAKIELISRGRVRRSKLYYLRDRRGNAARIKRKVGEYKSMGEVVDGTEGAAPVVEAAAAEPSEKSEGKKKKKKKGE